MSSSIPPIGKEASHTARPPKSQSLPQNLASPTSSNPIKNTTRREDGKTMLEPLLPSPVRQDAPSRLPGPQKSPTQTRSPTTSSAGMQLKHNQKAQDARGEVATAAQTESQEISESAQEVLRLAGRAKTIARAEKALGVDDGSSHTNSSQQQLHEYREKLARDLERRELSARITLTNQADKLRVSPIAEEAVSNSPMLSAALTTTSTESGNTIRGRATPTVAGTPSYPFPRMNPAAYTPNFLHKPFTTLSPTGLPQTSQHTPLESLLMHDRVLSGNSTPASNFTFQPPGAEPYPGNLDFPNPNLYELSLMLAAEPGLDAWWSTVVQIMKDVYMAERVTLAVPADTTDYENVPWGQKATYNEHQEDDLSLGYMARGSSARQSTDQGTPDAVATPQDGEAAPSPVRPGLPSRHSFTTYEENKEKARQPPTPANRRPLRLSRSRSYFPRSTNDDGQEQPSLSKSALDEHDAHGEEPEIPSWETPFNNERQSQRRVLPVLQALDYEADPLIDHAGVMRVLERGRAVALTRTYPYLDHKATTEQQTSQPQPAEPALDPAKKANKQRPDSTRLSSMLGSSTKDKGRFNERSRLSRLEDDEPRPITPKYEEYEQQPPSPWSQSPAPSPAIRADPKENPFFTEAVVDEESFNPGSAPLDYTAMPPPEAIGVDNSWTVLHIPLTHVLLSKPTNLFKLDTAALEQRLHQPKNRDEPRHGDSVGQASPQEFKRPKAAPIAILSILSPIIPYPTNLRHSLEHLAPHMATSFSLCRHYSNLETELAGLHRRRPATMGFGAVTTDGRPMESLPYLAPGDVSRQQSLHGSITSPSDYSAISKSATGSPIGTPGWEQSSRSFAADSRQAAASPAPMQPSVEGYFSSKSKNPSQRTKSSSKDSSPTEKRQSRLLNTRSSQSSADSQLADKKTSPLPDDGTAKQLSSKTSSEGKSDSVEEPVPDRQADQNRPRQGHSMLHSYGADFSSTFQSLPPSSSLLSRAPSMAAPSRSGSMNSVVDMPPPSDKLKGLILDTLPCQVFVALPQTGEIVWVNSRYLTYRGQSVADLAADPWGTFHVEDRDEYLRDWSHSLRTGEQFTRTVRIRRFDGAFRWHQAKAVASKDKRGVMMQVLGSFMDIHDQYIAEVKAARQQEIEASEAKHRLLANLIPQIIFTATEDEGITFANEQWLSYAGQSAEDCRGLGFMDYVHPDDLAQCRLPLNPQGSPTRRQRETGSKVYDTSTSSGATSTTTLQAGTYTRQALPRHDSSSGSESNEGPTADLADLARKGVIKVATDSNGRLSYTTEVRLRSKTGEYRWFLIRCVEIDTIDFGNGASSYFGSATDINDLKILETKLKEAMESKGRFLSNMSHEIRTPLIGISGMVSFLQDTTLNEEQRDYTNTIQTSANSLIMIINDILDLSKVDAGMMKLKFEWFHTRSLIEDVNELVSTMAIAKRLELNYLVEADVPAWVKGDKVRIRQVLLNVIGNAIKFTSTGEVFSRCRVYKDQGAHDGDNEIMLEFAIIDTGRGFSKEEAELIFKPFSQIDGSSTRQHGGSGLGLVISRQLVELHGGKMEGTAVLGKGSTFTFTARFALPTTEDHPSAPPTPDIAGNVSMPGVVQTLTGNALPPASAARLLRGMNDSPSSLGPETGVTSPEVLSASSSNPSVHSGRSHLTDKSSATSVTTGLARFSEAAKASGQDLSQMKLDMPSGRSSPGRTATPDNPGQPSTQDMRPLMYSILIICPQQHSREATAQHIEMTLPKDVPHQITALATIEEAQKYIGGEDPIIFTHIVVNLGSATAILDLMKQLSMSHSMDKTTTLILCDSVQRQAVTKLAIDGGLERLLSDNLVTFIYKPVKPSRFAVIFDPNKVRDTSIDRNRSTAQQMVETQKASYLEIEKRMGHRGYKVLLVEDNPVNQKVLTKYMNKIGVDVEVAVDGMECTDTVFSKSHDYYSLILCDLHMPRKDGYQACREIRQWEKECRYTAKPIIALSANVMSDVQDKCVAAGFSDYVTKPVDFIELSRAMAKFFRA